MGLPQILMVITQFHASQGDVLVFSYVGYTKQTITVGTSSTVNVSIESSTALDEVVVTGMVSQTRSKSVASIVTVKVVN